MPFVRCDALTCGQIIAPSGSAIARVIAGDLDAKLHELVGETPRNRDIETTPDSDDRRDDECAIR